MKKIIELEDSIGWMRKVGGRICSIDEGHSEDLPGRN